VANSAVQPGAQDVEFGFGHGSFEAEDEAIVEVARVIQAVGVGNQRSREGTEVE
jgi:hypothetical protein